MLDIGRICVKTAGRDIGKLGVIIEVVDDNHVVLDGYVRRRKVNIKHLIFLKEVLDIDKDTTKEEIIKLLDEKFKE